jgi:hypothetical protein
MGTGLYSSCLKTRQLWDASRNDRFPRSLPELVGFLVSGIYSAGKRLLAAYDTDLA